MRSAKIKLSLNPVVPNRLRGWSNPVVPGDHPDPTIVQVGDTFWASATSGEWSPQFPLFRSTDLVDWTPSGSIFPQQPAWAEGAFWAPELVHDEVSGRCFVWYVAKKRGGPLCIAMATAPTLAGPYVDHGPMVCEQDGSIDPCFARDEHGKPFLIWKEDGNSQNRPTPIWAQQLSEDFLHLVGEKTKLIVNDQPWEEGVVEGPYILRHDGRFYMFYAGNSCCGKECKYAEGVARTDRLLGPWEKFPGNPLIAANDKWRCPGHGTAVHAQGRDGKAAQDYLLYHAYPAASTIYVGREAVLDAITWSEPESDGKPGWPSVNAGTGPGEPVKVSPIDFVDDFESPMLGSSWQWPVNTNPDLVLDGGSLTLGIPLHSPLGAGPVESAMIAVPRPAGLHYRASVALDLAVDSDSRLWSGLAIVGDPFNTIGLGVRGDRLTLWQRRGATQAVLWQIAAPVGRAIYLRSTSFGAEHHLQFYFSVDGEMWQVAGDPYDASDLPAWDRGLRIGLMLEGPQGLRATFRGFELCADSVLI
ncbi:family 43 glycosylhydrolase [Granulicella arctica]|uniref:family 43 glycosylhydrolase n=1 Tax=Granulicella arctica TaxID=940613 RepID=UPI0021E0BB2F|nr:family 43 glycosylhydrolase [Granulicella arctica]